MEIALEKVCDLIVHARAYDVKEGPTDPDSGSNETDDRNFGSLAEGGTDRGEEEMRLVIEGLDVDEQASLIALVFVGRGDMEPAEWPDAFRLAHERLAAGSLKPSDYLMGIPNLGDLLDEGLAGLGMSCT
ncbi:DUF3775 domain-containing protein [Salinarimonas ramus]|uniref:DUF3775 domain-containing protein n=1 Tax=Salinarimonas ramus TaxID=690164 RepID=A0A917Q6R3_9HYPH|nr:DUF3775 domain-containing protein [Salinarimonas ramus]GGK31063.1 hypothetical protein GCM10011322_17090 [Salinarimonas ramus]